MSNPACKRTGVPAASFKRKGIPAKSTKPLRAGFSENRLSSVQTIQPTHTKPATDRENKVRTAKLQPVFAAAVCAADPDERRAWGLHSLAEVALASLPPKYSRALPTQV